MTVLPTEITYGKVVARFLLAGADSDDVDTVPDAIPGQGTVRFDPLVDKQRVTDPEVATVGIRPLLCALDAEGYLIDAQGNRGVWLVVGFYSATFTVKNMRIAPVEFEVTAAHTALAPLELNLAVPPDGPVLSAGQYAELSARIDGIVLEGGGVTDHGALTGLADDDHTQYFNQARGDARYALATDVTAALANKAAIAHGHLIADVTGLQAALDSKAAAGHDHTGTYAPALGADDNYVTDAEKAALHGHANKTALDAVSGVNTGDQVLPTWSTISGKPAVVAEGATATAARAAISAASTTHALSHGSGQSDAITIAESQVTGLTTALAGKAAASHAHSAADITSGTVTTARLGSGTADSTKFLRGDQTWAVPAGGGGGATLNTTGGEDVLLLGSDGGSDSTQNTGILVLGMFILPVNITFTSIGCQVGTGAASSTITLAIYTRSGTTLTEVFESSAIDTSTTGVKTQTGLSQSLSAGVYWVGSISTGGAPQVRRMAAASGPWVFPLFGSITGADPTQPFIYVGSTSAPLSSPKTISDVTNALQPALVRLGGVTY